MRHQGAGAVLALEALRLHDRYQREFVERFSICPWAKQARSDDRVRAHVVLETRCDPRSLRSVVESWAQDEGAEVAFIIAPLFDVGAGAFSKWAEEVGAMRPEVFVSAPFHPNASGSTSIVRFLRQTPDPTVQLVRRSQLQRARSDDPPHYTDIFDLDLADLERASVRRTVAESVAAHHARLLARHGQATLQSILDGIHRDRHDTYARLMRRGDPGNH